MGQPILGPARTGHPHRHIGVKLLPEGRKTLNEWPADPIAALARAWNCDIHSARSNLYATDIAYPSWEEPVRLLDQSLGAPEAHLKELADALGAYVGDNPSRALLVARLEDALSAKTGKQPPKPASPHQVRLLAPSDIGGAIHTAREADALIRTMIARERIDALRSLRPRRGDQLVPLDSDRRFRSGEVVRVTSIDRFGSVWVAGAGGYPSWPQHLARPLTDDPPQ